LILRSADGAGITWYEPPPVETITNEGEVRTVDRNLTEGFMNKLTWNFSLAAGSSIITVKIKLNAVTTVGTYIQSLGKVTVPQAFRDRFNFTWIPSNATLTIFNVTSDDNGEFTCEVFSVDESGTPTWKRGIQVNVVDPPSVTHISEDQTVNEKDIVNLNCTADGKPTPSITWTRLSDNKEVHMPLTIAGKHDEGAYRCTADNGIGNPVNRNVSITVENYHPIYTNLSTNLTDNIVVVNESLNLICSAQAKPSAKYRFYREQESLFNTTVGKNSDHHTTSVSERIKQVNFSCIPFNNFGDGLSDTRTVTVHYPPEIDPARSSQQVVEGSGVTLSCNATGNPPPSINWTKQGNSTVLSSSETLTLTNLMRGDDGAVYKCKVKNNLGSAEATATITVLCEYCV